MDAVRLYFTISILGKGLSVIKDLGGPRDGRLWTHKRYNQKITARPKPLIEIDHSVKRTFSISFSNNRGLASLREIKIIYVNARDWGGFIKCKWVLYIPCRRHGLLRRTKYQKDKQRWNGEGSFISLNFFWITKKEWDYYAVQSYDTSIRGGGGLPRNLQLISWLSFYVYSVLNRSWGVSNFS